MKTKCSLCFTNAFALLALLFALTVNLMAQPQYYNYNTAVGSNVFPFGVNPATGKSIQTLYLPGAFSQPSPSPSGNISKIYMMAVGSSNTTYTQLTIKMGLTTDVDLPVGAWYTTGMTTVFDQSSYNVVTTADQFFAITLTTPFAYDNTKSLVVEIIQCGYSGTGFGVRNTSLSGTKRHAGPLTAVSCPHPWGNSSAITTHTGIDIAPPNCSYSWATQTSGVTNLLQAVWAPTSSICWAAGAAATVRKTTDGGTTWTNANPNPGVITGDVYNIWALDANTAILTTSPGATFIYRTTNGGTNWTQVFTQTGGFIDAIVMSSATLGYAYGDPVGARWSLWKTTDGGATWDSTGMYLAQVGTEAGWNNAMSVVGTNIWFGTNNTKVYHSTNGGLTGSWTAGVTTGNVSTYGVWFTSATNGMCAGTIAQKTTDGGTTWTNAGTVGGAGNMTSIGGSGTNFWLTRGNNTYGTTDFGTTWTGTGYTGTAALWATSITNNPNGCLGGWSVGATGTIVKLTGNPVGIVNTNNQIPNEYRLAQNYPNPFNPTTNFIFALPKAGNVDLRVYDVLGREVETIVSEFKSAGSYTVEFNASNLTSGVYFYTLRTDDFTATKKMVLIK